MVALLQTPEVKAFFKSKDIPPPMPFFTISGGLSWPPDYPHISGTLDNVTVEEVFDRILQTFPGVWSYGNCAQDEKHKRAVYIRFYRLTKYRNRVSVRNVNHTKFQVW